MSSHRIRKFISPLVALVLAVVAATSLVVLERRAHRYRSAEVMLADASAQFALIGEVPIDLSRRPAALRATDAAIDQSEAKVQSKLRDLEAHWSIPALGPVLTHVKATIVAVRQLTDQGSGTDGQGSVEASNHAAVGSAASTVAEQDRAAVVAIQRASRAYDRLAVGAQTEALVATLLAIGVLLGAFLVFYFRWLGILQRTEHDARSDSLTGLGNRRALIETLTTELQEAGDERRLVLTLYDLDGFKQYNDAFGHLAGDALLSRFANRLRESLGESGNAYRMGGDEFCSLASIAPDRVVEHIAHARGLMQERGDGFEITCSAGSAILPAEAASARDALALADSRMYEHKGLSKRRPERSNGGAQAS